MGQNWVLERRNCRAKITYSSASIALEMCKPGLQAYKCPCCKKWHTTKRRDGSTRVTLSNLEKYNATRNATNAD